MNRQQSAASPDPATATEDELGLFIDSEGNFRILIPRAWNDNDELPQLAFLAVAALIRLSRVDQDRFYDELADWAESDLRQELGQLHNKFN